MVTALTMSVVSGALTVKLPGSDAWKDYRAGQSFTVAAGQKFQLRVAADAARAIEEARSREPSEPLLRGDELGLPPGPEIGRLLELVEEERAAGTISTREEALELVRRERGR